MTVSHQWYGPWTSGQLCARLKMTQLFVADMWYGNHELEIQGHRGQHTPQHVKFCTFSEVMPQTTST